MPPLIIAVVLGAGAYMGFKIAARVWSRLGDGASAAEPVAEDGSPATLREKDLGALDRDPATGIYRPRNGSEQPGAGAD